jgi:hypothetical protein
LKTNPRQRNFCAQVNVGVLAEKSRTDREICGAHSSFSDYAERLDSFGLKPIMPAIPGANPSPAVERAPAPGQGARHPRVVV